MKTHLLTLFASLVIFALLLVVSTLVYLSRNSTFSHASEALQNSSQPTDE